MSKDALLSSSIPLLPLDAQCRIVAALDHADVLRAKRRRAIALLDDLAKSVFLDMFGDPRTNPKGWDFAPLGRFTRDFRYGTSTKSAERGLPALRIPNVVLGELDLAEIKRVPVSEKEADRLRLHEGDLLFVRTNGNPDYVGRCAVFAEDLVESTGYDPSNFIYASYLIRCRVDRESVEPEFVRACTNTAHGRASLKQASKTSAGQFNLNIEGIKNLQIPHPPIRAQREYLQKIGEVNSLRSNQRSHLANLDSLFASLQQRAFRGDLWG